MPAGIGHNRGPTTPALNLPLGHPSVQALIAEIDRLMKAAQAEAGRNVRDLTQHEPWRFFPSRLRKSPRDRQVLADAFRQGWWEAILTRLPQIRRVNRKITRICPTWVSPTDRDWCTPPPFDPSERLAIWFNEDPKP